LIKYLFQLKIKTTNSMKKTFTLLSFLLTAFAVVKYSNLTSRPGSTPDGGYTGAPTTNLTCASSGCHSGSPTTDATKFTFKMSTSAIGLQDASATVTSSSTYVPGNTYWVSMALNGTGGRYGFSFTALNSSNAQAGTFTITDANTVLVNGSKDVSHKNANSTKGWTWKWNAPSTANPVSFYYVGMLANGTGNQTGDDVYKSSVTINAGAPTSINDENMFSALSVFPTQTMGDFAMNIGSATNTDILIELIDISGMKTLNLFNGALAAGSNNFRFNISDLNAGNYIISATSSGNRVTRQLIKL
jgi:hypothetical protein